MHQSSSRRTPKTSQLWAQRLRMKAYQSGGSGTGQPVPGEQVICQCLPPHFSLSSGRLHPSGFLSWPGLGFEGPSDKRHWAARYILTLRWILVLAYEAFKNFSIGCQYLKFRKTPCIQILGIPPRLKNQNIWPCWVCIPNQPELRSKCPPAMGCGSSQLPCDRHPHSHHLPAQKASDLALPYEKGSGQKQSSHCWFSWRQGADLILSKTQYSKPTWLLFDITNM